MQHPPFTPTSRALLAGLFLLSAVLPASSATLTVTSGFGSGSYSAGSQLVVAAGTPPAGKVFDRWTSTGALPANPTSPVSSYLMPATAVTLTANYITGPAPERYLSEIFADAQIQLTSNIPYGTDPAQKLDIYKPTNDSLAARPVLLYLHGGGYTAGKKTDFQGVMLCKKMAKRGFVAVSMEYRLLTNSESGTRESVRDARKAVDWLIANAATHGLDATKIIVAGHSAGGMIVIDLCYKDDTGTTNPLPAWSNRANIIAAIPHAGGRGGMQQNYRYTDTFLPALEICGTSDSLYGGVMQLTDEMQNKRAHYSFFPMVNFGHSELWQENGDPEANGAPDTEAAETNVEKMGRLCIANVSRFLHRILNQQNAARGAYEKIEAESFSAKAGTVGVGSGANGSTCLVNITNGDYVMFKDVDCCGTPDSFNVTAASGNSNRTFKVFVDHPEGAEVASVDMNAAGGVFAEVTTKIIYDTSGVHRRSRLRGVHDLYVKFSGGLNPGLQVDSFKFIDYFGNFAPTASPQTVGISRNTPQSIPLSGSSDVVTYKVTKTPAAGLLTGTWPNVSYSPASNFVGSDTFEFQTDDGKTVSQIAKVTLNVTAVNQAPVPNAGPDQTIVQPVAQITLAGSVQDDWLPMGATVLRNWTKLSGPGTVTFASPGSANTTATIPTAGVYVLQLTANDTALSASDTMTVTVYTQQESWRLSYFGTSANSGSAADTADPDDDGLSNAYEFQTSTDPTAPDGLIAFWTLDSSYLDATGATRYADAGPNHLDLKLENGPLQAVTGYIANGLDGFDTLDNRCLRRTEADVANPSTQTLEAWVMFNSTSQLPQEMTGTQCIFGRPGQTDRVRFYFEGASGAGYLKLHVLNNNTGLAEVVSCPLGTSVVKDVWYQAAYSFKPNGTTLEVTLYLTRAGSPVTPVYTKTIPNFSYPVAGPVTVIGEDFHTGRIGFSGIIDEVRYRTTTTPPIQATQ